MAFFATFESSSSSTAQAPAPSSPRHNDADQQRKKRVEMLAKSIGNMSIADLKRLMEIQ